MTPMTKNEKQNEEMTDFIINDIERKFLNEGCKNIGKKWVKKCPLCEVEMFYSFKQSLDMSIRKKCLCRKCSKTGNKNVHYGKTGYWKNKIGPNKGKIVTVEFRRKMSDLVKGRKHTELSKKKMSIKTIGKNTWSKGRLVSKETRCKLRIKRLEDLKLKGIFVGSEFSKNYNKNACEFIDKINNKFGYNLQHALNGGEVIISGFSLDGYDKIRNIVFEYDEPYHNVSRQIEKDKIRQQIIIDKLNPIKFLRFNEEYKKMIDVISGKEIII